MVCHGKPFSCLSDLRMFVNETICDQEQLEVGAFQMTERILTRCGHPCGIYFCVHGPRQVKFTAIWETDNNTVMRKFYHLEDRRENGIGMGMMRNKGQVFVMARTPFLVEHISNDEADGG